MDEKLRALDKQQVPQQEEFDCSQKKNLVKHPPNVSF